MDNVIKTLDSGANIELQMASFEKGHKLMQAVKQSSIPLEDIIDVILSEKVQGPLWDCMAVCLYNGQKINKASFEDGVARGDYLPVAKEVLVFNLTPFFKNLASRLSGVPPTADGESQR